LENKEIIFGRNPVHEYLKNLSSPKGVNLFVSEKAHGKIIEIIKQAAKNKGVHIEMCPKEKLSSYHNGSNHQGVILEIPGKQHSLSKESLLKETFAKKGVLVLLDQLTDPHNIGSIIRTAEALGAQGIVLPKANSPEITGTIAKTSSGATAHIPILHISNVASFIEDAKQHDLWVIGTTDHANTDLSKISEIKPAVVIIGSEGGGMRKLTEEKCDYTVKIPLKGKISSLNASVAAGIVLYELLK
jgi:23S rRNA (guanosine2251-2'-O)-methyltransferase